MVWERLAAQCSVIIFILSIVAVWFVIPSVYASDTDHTLLNQNAEVVRLLNVSISNISITNLTIPSDLQTTPAPITLFHFEHNQTSLSGPRYMAYGPWVIELKIQPPPVSFILLIAIIVLVLGLYWVYSKKRLDKK
ncbi:MAG: hypothetical protein ABR887_04300 [Methanoregulaceae archaeon]|jgi:hypothetical protein